MGKRIDLTGKRFGRLTAIKPSGKYKDGQFLWECLCDCGCKKLVPTSNLTRGATQSCGCYRREQIIASRYTDEFRSKISNIQREICLNDLDTYCVKRFGMQDDTNIAKIKSKKAQCDSSTGVRGVYYRKDSNTYRVQLQFQKKVYREYGFKTLEDAAKARERMWKTYVLPYLEENHLV